MDLTQKNQDYIDSLSYQDLLWHWRMAPVGDPWFQGATGAYWSDRMAILRRQNPAEHVRSSKTIGWEK